MNKKIAELREVVQKLVPLLSGKGLKVTQRGSRAYVSTDTVTKRPVSVNIPNIPETATDDFILAIQGFIDHEIAHVLITDWTVYGGSPSAKEMRDPKVQRFLNLHNIIEDTMIEKEIVKIFPGSRRNLTNVRKHFLTNVTAVALKSAKSPQDEFSYLVVPVMRALAGHEEMQDFMDAGKYWDQPLVKALMDELPPQFLADMKTAKSTKDTYELSRTLESIMYPPEPPAPPAPPAPPPPDAKSEDKPEKEADEGDGDGERDHSEQDEDPNENEDDGEVKSDPKEIEIDPAADPKDEADTKEDEDEDEADAEDSKDKNDAGDSEDKQDAGEDKQDAGESEDDAEEDDAGEDESAGDKAEGDTDDADDEGESDKTGSAQPGDEEGDEEGSVSGSVFISDGSGGEQDGFNDYDEDAEPETGIGTGVGSSVAKSVFDFLEDDAFEKADLSSAIAVLISKEAVEAMNNSDYKVFTREADRIEPVVPPEKMNKNWVPDMELETQQMSGRMQKDIERIMASQSHIIRTPGHRKGKLHAPSLFRVSQGDPRVFSQKQEHVSKDTAVMLLADNSGSMGGAKMKLAMISSYALASTLERVKIANEVLGFTTGNWGSMPRSLAEAMHEDMKETGISYDREVPIVIPIYKSFDERIDATIKKRFAYMMNAQHGLSGNIDGESLQYAAERLMKRPEKRKVMIVLSDGQPAGGRSSGPHLKGVVRDLIKVGIECIGIGIQDSSVSKYYPNHTVLMNLDELPTKVMGEIKKLLL